MIPVTDSRLDGILEGPLERNLNTPPRGAA